MGEHGGGDESQSQFKARPAPEPVAVSPAQEAWDEWVDSALLGHKAVIGEQGAGKRAGVGETARKKQGVASGNKGTRPDARERVQRGVARSSTEASAAAPAKTLALKAADGGCAI